MNDRMQGLTLPRGKGILGPSSVLMLLLLGPLGDLPGAHGSCEFPSSWAGEWYQYGKLPPIYVNATVLGDRTCVERSKDKYVVYFSGEKCYYCMITSDRHENVIQYREGWCFPEKNDLEDMCSQIGSDDPLYSMFRLNSKPIPCPFSGSSFTFSYNKGHGECANPMSLAEKCTDESKILLKYQACADIESTESNTEELQCLAVWNDGRYKYLVGTLTGRNALASGATYRCFLYEEKTHHQGKVFYLLAQSGDPTCNGLSTIDEGSPNIKLSRVDKEHKCKYPSWVTEHHDWHSLDGTKVYHFTNKNATLKVKVQEGDGEAFHEEKIVCHNLEKLYPNDNMQGHKVKLVAHVTSGCDIGYVCMIFHKRDSQVIELQESSQKAIMPDEACSLWDPSDMPHTTLITSVLHRRKCPNLGRYPILRFDPSQLEQVLRRERRSNEKSLKTAERRTWPEDAEAEECRNTNVQIGCSTPEQNEIVIGNTCDREEMAYVCHGSWEERGTWYTIVSHRTPPGQPYAGLGQTYCLSMRSGSTGQKGTGRQKSSLEHELRFMSPGRTCQREPSDEWAYTLANQGVCEELTKTTPSLASVLSVSRTLSTLIMGTTAYRILVR